MTIEEALKTTIKRSNLLTDKLSEKSDVMTEGEHQAIIQLGILFELRAIRLILQTKENE